MSSQPSPAPGWAPVIGEIVRAADSPLSISELRRRLGSSTPKKSDLESAVRDAVASGAIFEWPKQRYWMRNPATHVSNLLRDALSAGPKDLRSILQSRKSELQKLNTTEIASILEQLTAGGSLHRAADGRNWILSLTPFPSLEASIAAAASEKPWTKPELVKAVCARQPFFAASVAGKEIDRMRKQGDLRTHGKGKAAVIFSRPSDVERFLRVIVDDAVSRTLAEWRSELEPMGIAVPDNVSAPKAPEDVAGTMLKTIREVEPQSGYPVAVRKLRQMPVLRQIPKPVFDAAAIELIVSGRAYPFQHTAPMSLPADERDSLVEDGRGNFYVGLAWR